MRKFLQLSSCFVVLSAYGQSIKGKVQDTLSVPVAYATVALVNATDSSVIKGTVCDVAGDYQLDNIRAGKYLLRSSAAGYRTLYQPAELKDTSGTLQLKPVILKPDGINLSEIAVSAIQKPIEFKHGNIVMNVENSPLAAGNTVMDLILRIPGVSIQNNEIMVNGSPGIKVYIDDRAQQMAGSQLLSFLRSMSSSGVSIIELIKNPPARYDAQGSAGIINIKTKKLKITGLSGSAGYRFSQGWAAQHDADLSLNHKGKKVNLFSSCNLTQLKYLYRFTSTKNVVNQGKKTEVVSEVSELHEGGAATMNLGIDWYVTEKTIVGAKTQLIPGRIIRTREGSNALSDKSLGYEKLTYTKRTPNDYLYLNTNLNLEHSFDTLGTRLRFSADYYAPYYDFYYSEYSFRFYDGKDIGASEPENLRGLTWVNLNIISGRLDFEKALGKKIKIEAGVKNNHQLIPSFNHLDRQDTRRGNYVRDTAFSNEFTYKENIAAAYGSLKAEWKKFSVQTGLRAENTYITTSSIKNSYEFKRNYIRLFPSLTIDRNLNKDHTLSFAYNKRIWRPHYESLSPYFLFNHYYSWSTGNPYLQPQITDHLMISHTFRSSLFTSIHYYYQKDPIRGRTLQIDSSLVTIFTIGNLKFSNELQLQIFYSQDLKKWWNANMGIGGYFYDFNGSIDGRELKNAAYSFHVSMNHVFSLPKGFKIEFSGYYVAPWLTGGFYQHRSRGAVEAGISRALFKDRCKITFTASDIFYSSKNRSEVRFYNQNQQMVEAYDSQRYNVSIRWDFGKMKVQERQIKRSDDVKERMGK